MAETPATPETFPPWHRFGIAGVLIFIGGLALLAIAWFATPAPFDGDAVLNYQEFDQYKAILALCELGHWLGDRMVAGGFFIWLAGRLIDAYRHPTVY